MELKLNPVQKILRRDALKIAFDFKLSHIPSAFSMIDYLFNAFANMTESGNYDKEKWRIVLGKPFGSCAYYSVWQNLFDFKPVVYEEGVSEDSTGMVDFGERTIGNGLGVAIGMALGDKSKKVFCNISDGALQTGQTLEAILFLLQHSKELNNLFLAIDFNDMQVLGKTENIVSVGPVMKMLWQSKLNLHIMNCDYWSSMNSFSELKLDQNEATVFICHTKKGLGIKDFEQDPVKYHYYSLTELDFKKYMEELK